MLGMVRMRNIDSFMLENWLRLISEGKIKEWHVMAYFKNKLK